MGNIKIPIDKQRVLRDTARAEIYRLEKIQESADTLQLLDSFKNKFNICETAYKVILKEHQRAKGKNNGTYLQVTMTQVPHALSFAGYTFDKELLNDLFGSTSKKGMTVKKLRDAVTHSIDEKAVEEILKRKDELFRYMNEFLNTMKTFDQVA